MDFAGQIQPDNLEDATRMIWDRLAVTDILHRYCHALDRRDWALIRTCFHPNSKINYENSDMESEDFIHFAQKMAGFLLWTVHQLSNFTIDLRDDDVARTESYVFAYHRIPAATEGDYFFRLNGQEQIARVACRYVDRFEKRHGLWRIAHRTIPIFESVDYWAPEDGGFAGSDTYRNKQFGDKDPGYILTKNWR